jgi:GNAT superfamily N-acetyltransferase
MRQLTVREADEMDAPQLVRVRIDAWRAAYAGVIPPAYLDELDATAAPARLAEYLRALPSGRHYLVSEQGGRLTGFVVGGAERPSVESARGERDGFGEVHALYVHPDAWFTGTGAALLRAATRRLAEDGFHTLSLWVMEQNEQARRFYERHGWRPDGARDELRFGGALVPEVRYTAPAPARPVTRPVSGSALPRQRRAHAEV